MDLLPLRRFWGGAFINKIMFLLTSPRKKIWLSDFIKSICLFWRIASFEDRVFQIVHMYFFSRFINRVTSNFKLVIGRSCWSSLCEAHRNPDGPNELLWEMTKRNTVADSSLYEEKKLVILYLGSENIFSLVWGLMSKLFKCKIVFSRFPCCNIC